jgi:hypothetical protein
VSKPDWSIGDAIAVLYDQEDRIDGIATNSANLFLTLQCIMNDLHFEWFHPDNLMMIVRTPAGEFIVLEAEYADREVMRLFVRMEHGSEAAFRAVFGRIAEVLQPADPFSALEALADGSPRSIPD